jgi:ribosome modulation factor
VRREERREGSEGDGSGIVTDLAPMWRQLKRGLKRGPRAAVAVRSQNQNPRRVPERRSQTVSGQQIKFMNVRVSIELATRVGGDSP